MLKQDWNSYWKTVVDTIHDGVMIVDNQGVVVSINKGMERISGFKAGEMVGKSCTMLNCDICEIAQKDGGGHWCALFATGRINERRCNIVRRDGKTFPVLKNASLLKDSDGETIGAVETITDISELIEKDNRIQEYQRELRREDGFFGLIGQSEPMRRIFSLIRDAAGSDAPVIIYGESGTGKELAARAIHNSRDPQKPFVAVNCAALNEQLLESELFGHEKGAFTGADKKRTGRFEAAHGGAIFLDEVGDLPLSTQVKLLRVLEQKVIERVGSSKPIPIDVRVISATNRDLGQMVREGRFRQDLYYRLNVIPVHLPPLRERREDIPLLSTHFLTRARLKSGKNITGISNEALRMIVNHVWPGNVRELKSAFEYAFVTCHGDLIEPRHLPPVVAGAPLVDCLEPAPAEKYQSPDDRARTELIEALEKSNGNQTEAARLLGVSRVTVWNRMKRYGVDLKSVVNK
ncbi:PAS domain S-box-containing protein [Desulfatibacillum alkenivorans DSM 16219]|jgi:PAS domain S-box-containing protein|uniref:PAS domain S-box-containing protein n=1 Tax=Desulfatibacillum alkenivorans DSM 16219 TaxID=1121393 RepID=A0A1M6CGC0_9BACT|nr:sigma 54-interacting transcriptional regulator [Desulfatibacillum alkenivorans]SHI60036.1 PAS domain S-box-containing protein [Desulfatibacillum alkenivorans DSM 16219]